MQCQAAINCDGQFHRHSSKPRHFTKNKQPVTYSWEKESPGETISLYYKPESFTDDEWIARGGEERGMILFNAEESKHSKNKKDIIKIVPTSLAPDYLSHSPTFEFLEESLILEIKHKSFEYDTESTLRQLKTISKELGETHSFHVHVVFDLEPNAIDQVNHAFRHWWKSVNDYAVLRGLEEGMFPSMLTKIAPSDVQGIKPGKTYSVGFRDGIYGNSPDRKFERVGLELRDTFRKNLDDYKEMLDDLTDAVIHERWGNLPEDFKKRTFKILARDEAKVVGMKKSKAFAKLLGIPEEHFKYLLEVEPNMILPLQFDPKKMDIWDYRTGKPVQFTDQEIAELNAAQELYVNGIRNLSNELKKFDVVTDIERVNYQSEEAQQVILATRQWVVDWAKKAKASRYFK